jgi:hypothetical protein
MTRGKGASKTPEVWVLTREHNDYDQYGEYFEAVWLGQPSIEQLSQYFVNVTENKPHFSDPMAALDFILHIRKGGGRRGTEDTWFNLGKKEPQK